MHLINRVVNTEKSSNICSQNDEVALRLDWVDGAAVARGSRPPGHQGLATASPKALALSVRTCGCDAPSLHRIELGKNESGG